MPTNSRVVEEPMDVTIIANPFSGAKVNRHRVMSLGVKLRYFGLSPQTIWDVRYRRRMLSDPRWQRQQRCVVSAGGDGTFASVINACAGYDPNLLGHDLDPIHTSLALLPMGNENLVARELDFVPDVARLARAILNWKRRRIDLLRFEQPEQPPRYCALMLSAGFDAEAAHRLAHWRDDGGTLKRVRRISYARPIYRTVRHYPFPKFQLTAEGQTFTGCLALLFNVPRYAIGLEFVPGAECDDGLIHWVMFQKPGRVNLLRYALAVLQHRHLDLPDVQWGAARRITLECDQHVPVQVDGDAAGFLPVTVECARGAVNVIDMHGVE